ncbi:hypothetical protein COMA1_20523 [Candidatus Nitrospira nitrosa]|uniref:Uncharacterized protein n=1 Tax=Candidatus Nitrospira nitrosa TaxID=1742972 RepID=A0A0S4LJ13_9BACT|nr:hypothetical protein COMA1_20523 [Candidatus Nitrospira nitrosa]
MDLLLTHKGVGTIEEEANEGGEEP